LNIIEANNPTLAFNLFLARADKNDEIVTKRKRKGVKKDISAFTEEEEEEEEEEEKGKFLRVTDLTTVRTSTYIDREEQINILMIYKVFYFSFNKQTNKLSFFCFLE